MNLLLISLIAIFSSLEIGNVSGSNSMSPSKITFYAKVNTDKSGNVSFIATSSNAITYHFEYGNGVSATVSSGSVTYKYPATGNYTVNVIAKNSTGQTVSKSIRIKVTVLQKLIWSDEFNTPGAPDSTKWGYDLGNGCPNICGWGNNELQYYTNRPENVIVSGGTLKIIAKAENYSGKDYTSARILSKDKFSFKYGKVEVRAKIPGGIGTWPAIWTLGSNINTAGWPACGEMDIMEHRGSELNKIFGTLHYPGFSGSNADGNTKLIPNATTEFHIYSMEWTATGIKIFADRQLIHSIVNSSNVPFNQNFFFILNMAMGGGFAGPVDPAFTSATMEIDYIRVYQ